MAETINLVLNTNAGGTVNAITLTYSPAISAYTDKRIFAFVSSGANTSATPTVNINGLGARTIVKKGGQALVAGDIGAVESVHFIQYDLTNTRFELMNPCIVFGTTAGTVAEGNRAANTFSGYQGYYISAGFSTAFNPADSTTYFFGTRTVAPATTGGVRRIPLSAGTAYHVLLWISNGGTLGSNEDVSFYLRINDTTDVTISTTVKTNIAEQVLSFTITDTAVVAGDYAEIKMVTPAYATNPTTVIINGAILMK